MAPVSRAPHLPAVSLAPPADDVRPDEAVAPPSFEAIYAGHAAYVAGLAGRILGRNHEVPDVVQDVFLIAHRRLAGVRQPDSVRAWLGRITVREASRRLRWWRVRLFLHATRTIEADLVAVGGTDRELRPLVALLYANLDRLPARLRIPWVLRHLLGEPLDAVAELSGCSLATAKRRIAAADQVLRPVLGGGEEDE